MDRFIVLISEIFRAPQENLKSNMDRFIDKTVMLIMLKG